MSKCILCQLRPPDPKKPEHILLNALGGRKTTTKAICSECNNIFGAGPDAELSESVKVLRNTASLKSGDGKKAPMLKNIEEGGIRYNLEEGLKPIYKPKKALEYEKKKDGIYINITARDTLQLGQILHGLTKKAGFSEAQKTDFFKQASKDITKITGPAPGFRGHLNFGSRAAQRSMAKACFVLWADLVGNSEANKAIYDKFREFIFLDGIEGINGSICTLDTRPLPTVGEEYGPNPNVIWVGSDNSGEAYGYFRLYGAIGWRFLICEENAPVNMKVCLVSNPMDNKIWDCDEELADQIQIEWVKADYDPKDLNWSDVNGAFSNFMSYAQDKAFDSLVTDLYEETLDEMGIKEGSLLTRSQVNSLISSFTNKLAHALARVPRHDPLKKSNTLNLKAEE